MRLLVAQLSRLAGPVREATLRFGTLTVLVGVNDAGKSRLLADLVDLLDPSLRPPEQPYSWSYEIQDNGETRRLWRGYGAPPEADWPTIDVMFVEGSPTKLSSRPPEHRSANVGDPGEDVDLTQQALAWLESTDGPARIHLPAEGDELQIKGRRVSRTVLPAAKVLPSSVEDARRDLVRVFEDLAELLRGPVPRCASVLRRWQDGPGYKRRVCWEHFLEASERFTDGAKPSDAKEVGQQSPFSLLQNAGAELVVHPVAEVLCSTASRMASHLLPPLIADRYELRFVPGDVTALLAGQGMQPVLAARSDGGVFTVETAAHGYALWVEFVLREIERTLSWAASTIEHTAGELDDLIPSSLDEEWLPDPEALDIDREEWPELPDREQCIDRVIECFYQVLVVVLGSDRETSQIQVQNLSQSIMSTLIKLEDFGIAAPRPPSPVLYLIDEPERGLQPAAQRSMAAWLAALLEDRNAQAVIATHALPFILADGNAMVYEVIRASDRAAVTQILVKDFQPGSFLARAMGFDDGALLARYHGLIFVEGEADRSVLEAFFAKRLKSARLHLIPLHGHRHLSGLGDLTLLTQAWGGPVGILLDGVAPNDIDRYRNDARDRRDAKGRGDEQETAARLVEAELASEHQFIWGALGQHDLFDAFDNRAIKDLHPEWPGHLAARFELHRGNGKDWKDYYRRRYGIDTSVRGMVRYAQRSVELEIAPPSALERLIASMEAAAAAWASRASP